MAKLTLTLALIFALICSNHRAEGASEKLLIGWARTDITPELPANLAGMKRIRIATEVKDPLTATALALEAPYQPEAPTPLILISCDLRSISEALSQGVRAALKDSLPDVPSTSIILNATHSHTAPPLSKFGLPLEGADEDDYLKLAIPRITQVAIDAWNNRQPGGISFGLTFAMIGANRIMAYEDGTSRMYGPVDLPEFSHVEGFEDSSVQTLCTWDSEGKLTGIVLNVAVPAQVSESYSFVSADFWHETREEIDKRLGEGIFLLPQSSSAGDQVSRPHIYARAEERMEKLTGRSRREQIAVRLVDAINSILPVLKEHIDWAPVLGHRFEVVGLPRRIAPEDDLNEIMAAGQEASAKLQSAMDQLEKNPQLSEDEEWRESTSRLWWSSQVSQRTEDRLKVQRSEPTFPTELHAIRIGDAAMAMNPFELYLDYGLQIKTRVEPVQTFLVQLAGPGSYIPTERSIKGGAYGSKPSSTNVGPEGGRELVNWTIDSINALWD